MGYAKKTAGAALLALAVLSVSAAQAVEVGSIIRAKPEKKKDGLSYTHQCGCNTGRQCTGPKGGRFCITDSGRKRY